MNTKWIIPLLIQFKFICKALLMIQIVAKHLYRKVLSFYIRSAFFQPKSNHPGKVSIVVGFLNTFPSWKFKYARHSKQTMRTHVVRTNVRRRAVFPSCWGTWWLRKNSVGLRGLVWCGIGKCPILPACCQSFLLWTDSVTSLLIETCRHLNTCFCSASNYSVYVQWVINFHIFLLASCGYKARGALSASPE